MLWANFSLSMQSFCMDRENKKRSEKEVLGELLGDELAWSGSHGMLIFANKCVQIQRNYELLLEQNKGLSDLYSTEQARCLRIQDRLNQQLRSDRKWGTTATLYENQDENQSDDYDDVANGVLENGTDDEWSPYSSDISSYYTFSGNNSNDDRNSNRSSNRSSNSNNVHTAANRRLLQDLNALESTKDLLVQSQKQLTSQKDYITGLESLVASSNKKIEHLTIKCDNLKAASLISSKMQQQQTTQLQDKENLASPYNQIVVESLAGDNNRIYDGSLLIDESFLSVL